MTTEESESNRKKICNTMITISLIEASPDAMHEVNVFIELYLGNHAEFTETARVILDVLSLATFI